MQSVPFIWYHNLLRYFERNTLCIIIIITFLVFLLSFNVTLWTIHVVYIELFNHIRTFLKIFSESQIESPFVNSFETDFCKTSTLFTVLFCDEASFSNTALVNKHILYYYNNRKPHLALLLYHQPKRSVNVWSAILGGFVFGTLFFDGS